MQIEHASGELSRAPALFPHVSLSFEMERASGDENNHGVSRVIRWLGLFLRELVSKIRKSLNNFQHVINSDTISFRRRVGVATTLSNFTFDFHG